MKASANGGKHRPTGEPEMGWVDETVECESCSARWTNQTGEPLRACPSCGRSGPMRLVQLDMYEPVPPAVPGRADLERLVASLEEQTSRFRSLCEEGWELGDDAGDGVVHLVRRYGTGEVRRRVV